MTIKCAIKWGIKSAFLERFAEFDKAPKPESISPRTTHHAPSPPASHLHSIAWLRLDDGDLRMAGTNLFLEPEP